MKKIVILIPHYNNLEGLESSLESISSDEPVNVLIVDDGSQKENKPKETKLKEQYPQISNIICLDNIANRGIEYVLNDGLKYAQEKGYKYIARLDCGDVCHRERFKLQKEFLDTHLDYFLVGSWVNFVDLTGKKVFEFKPETTHNKIEKKMPIANQFSHPAVMFRTSVLEQVGYYPLDRKSAEDYAYFYKFVNNFKTANLSSFLVDCEINPSGISLQTRKKQIASRIKVILDNFQQKPSYYYALARNLILYFLPYKLVENLKRLRK